MAVNTSRADRESISQAAHTLAAMPRRIKRKWTGWLHGEHCWRGRRIVLPNGEVAPLLWCSRGRVLLQNSRDLPFRDWLAWAARREHEVRVYKHPSAIALGQRKKGLRECPSEQKSEAARRNGRQPVRKGSRPRGRPPSRTIPCGVPSPPCIR
jgi:hypothetical protein